MPKREPGRRASADRILAEATLLSTAAICVAGAVAVIFVLVSAGGGMALSIAIGSGIVAASNALSLCFNFVIPRWFSSHQGISFVGGFVIKLCLLLILLSAILGRDWLNMPAFFLAFAGAIVLSLIVNSLVIMREQGPEIEIENPTAEIKE